jgi:predicted Zn finger-like uncharacterized protein
MPAFPSDANALAMPDEKFTRCPGCSTVYRVTLEQLALRDGQVRCGHCLTIFDGNAQMISLAPRVGIPTEPDELALGPPTVTLRSARALDPPPPDMPAPPREPSFRRELDAEPDAESAQRTSDKKSRRAARVRRRLYAATIPVLALLLIGQVVFHYRDALAARWPVAKPALAKMCAAAGCAIRPLRDVTGLAIDASDLQADPAHRGLLILTATIRNRATTPLAYPYLELTLTDANDQLVVRRALAPAEYASGTVEIANGIPANGEVLVKLFIDASTTTQAGYRLYLFYV